VLSTLRGHPFMTSAQRGRASQAQVDASGWGQLHVDVHKKLEPNNVTLSSSHAKKLVLLYQNFVFGRNKK